MENSDKESGYLYPFEVDSNVDSAMHDVEILRVTTTNVIARGKRYGRQWLLKGLREDLRDSAVMQRQLRKEFEIHSRLWHPSVVRVAGMENVDGLGWCIVQEWIDGITLHETLLRVKMKPSERRRICRALIETVAYLHSCGIVHRDLKPSNVMIRDIGREIVLIDFGLADTSDYVEIKGAAGTPGFISPEQMISGGAHPYDDVYSLGVIMAELTPCYVAIARRCKETLQRRPTDARVLLKLLDRSDRRRKILPGLILFMMVTFLVIFAILKINTLEQAATDSGVKVSELSAKDKANLILISSLKDSLSSIKGSLDSAKNELTRIAEYENLKQTALRDGYKQIDNALLRADREIFSKITEGDIYDYNSKLGECIPAWESIIEDYYVSLQYSSLMKDDVEKIRSDLYSYQAIKFSQYQKKWLKRINL